MYFNNKIYCSNLPRFIREKQLYNYLSRYGKVNKIMLHFDVHRQFNNSATAICSSPKTAVFIKKKLNGKFFYGRKIYLENLANNKNGMYLFFNLFKIITKLSVFSFSEKKVKNKRYNINKPKIEDLKKLKKNIDNDIKNLCEMLNKLKI